MYVARRPILFPSPNTASNLTERSLTIESVDPLLLFGFNDAYLRRIEGAFPDVRITARGNRLLLKGGEPELEKIERIVNELSLILNRNGNLTEQDVDTVLALRAAQDGAGRSETQQGDVVLFTHSGGMIRAKTPNQLRLVDAARTLRHSRWSAFKRVTVPQIKPASRSTLRCCETVACASGSTSTMSPVKHCGLSLK